tara:strand:- start:593 stop:1678 length:1086 start_codon:yes stop_codon:yes gene_type:complete
VFTGDRLRVARQRRALTKKSLAEQIGVAPRAITGWEADEYPPEPHNVAKIVSVLGFPVSFFKKDETSQTPSGAISFRSLTTKTAAQRDAVLAMCDIAKDVTSWMDTRFGLPEPDLPDLSDEEPSVAALLVRQEWGMGNKPIKNLLSLLEAKGVRVFALPDNCREIDACSFWSDDLPFVLLNTEKSSERSRFDMAHELGHLILHKRGAPSGRQAETEANAFASEFLMPEPSVQANRARNWSIGTLIQKKKIWNVSVSALAYRLHKLGFMSDWHFKSLNIEMQRRGFKKVEPDSSPHEQSKVFEHVLARLREKRVSLRFAANEISIPESELRGLIYGLAKVSFEGSTNKDVSTKPGSHLTVIK